jgi:hypothetical protein
VGCQLKTPTLVPTIYIQGPHKTSSISYDNSRKNLDNQKHSRIKPSACTATAGMLLEENPASVPDLPALGPASSLRLETTFRGPPLPHSASLSDYRGTSLTRNTPLLGPHMPRLLWRS